ncbi:MAG: tetratricopeptide repeat protein [Aliifodinibius sp.]|nr:tetratricopeptide repeat protein [Fodinibius sp.]
MENKQYTRAIVQFNLALERAPDSAPIKDALNSAKRQLNAEVRNLVNDAREEFQSGNYANALQILSDARVLAPEDQELKEQINTLANRIKYQQYFQEALILLDIGDYQKALSLFEEALKLDPNNERLRQYISEAKRGMSTKREEMDPESNKKFYEGMDRFLAGDYEAALNIWRALEEKYPFNTQLQNAIKTAEERLERAQ